MNHVIITMMNYRKDHPKESKQFIDRLEIYKKTVLPRIKAQTKQNFDIAVLCDRKNAQIFKDMGIIPFHTKDGYAGHYTDVWHFNTPWENIEGLKKYDIQTVVLSDDLISEKYIEKIEEVIEQNKEGDKSIHIQFQPRLYNLETGQEKAMSLRYSNGFSSPMYSIYQPGEKYYFIHHDSHTVMPKYFDKSFLIGEGYCWLTAHSGSLSITMST